MPARVLVVDDEVGVRKTVQRCLTRKNYEVHTAGEMEEGYETLNSLLPEVALVDLRLREHSGLDLIRRARQVSLPTNFVVISGYGTVQNAVEAVKLGACDFLEKPFSPDRLQQVVEQAAGDHEWSHKIRQMDSDGIRAGGSHWQIVGVSDAIREVYSTVLAVSQNNHSTVLIQGESGTGKELIARAIFDNSPDCSGRFVDVNCAALSETLLEGELFGHEKGAFTGANSTREGLFEAADEGLIFLDEIGDMPWALQAKLLRVLEEKSFKRVGGTVNIEVNFRVIASTNRNLARMVEKGTFRDDLFYRLNVFNIEIPPLRHRPEDIPPLCHFMLERLALRYEKGVTRFSDEAMERLMEHDWPGNVRELRNAVERGLVMTCDNVIKPDDLGLGHHARHTAIQTDIDALPPQSIESMEKKLILRVLEANDWHKAKSAEVLGINRTTLWHKIKRYELEESNT